MPAVQLDDIAAQLAAHGAINYVATSLAGGAHSFEYWPQIKSAALAFLATAFAPPTPTPRPHADALRDSVADCEPSPTPARPPVAPQHFHPSRHRPGRKCSHWRFHSREWRGVKKVIVRAIGPSLAAAGITSALADPSLQLVDATGKTLAANNDWMTGGQTQEIIDTTLAPNDPKRIRHRRHSRAGAYTAIVTGVDGPQRHRPGGGLRSRFDESAASCLTSPPADGSTPVMAS